MHSRKVDNSFFVLVDRVEEEVEWDEIWYVFIFLERNGTEGIRKERLNSIVMKKSS